MWKWELGIPIPDENLLCWLWHLVYPVSFNRQCLCYGDWRIMGKTMRTVLYHIVLCSCAHFIITLLWAVLTGGCGLFLCVYFVSFSYLRPVCVLCFICFLHILCWLLWVSVNIGASRFLERLPPVWPATLLMYLSWQLVYSWENRLIVEGHVLSCLSQPCVFRFYYYNRYECSIFVFCKRACKYVRLCVNVLFSSV